MKIEANATEKISFFWNIFFNLFINTRYPTPKNKSQKKNLNIFLFGSEITKMID